MAVPALNRNGLTVNGGRQLAIVDPARIDPTPAVPGLNRNGMIVAVPLSRVATIQPATGPKGDPGEDGQGGLADSFETVAANLDASGAMFSYAGDTLASITYANGVSKLFTYGPDGLASVTLSGAIPDGIATIKTLNYTGGNLTSLSYS
jgi:hypothetical protein